MKPLRLRITAVLASALLLVPGAIAAKPAPIHHAQLPSAAPGNWPAMVAVTPSGSHVFGNPKAAVKLTEYLSYTCPHCAHFQTESDAILQMVFAASGKGSVEIVPYLRNSIDLAVALLANCASPAKFASLHRDFLHNQDSWMAPVLGATPAQLERWNAGATPATMRAIAGDLHLYAIMERHGFSHADADRCLADTDKMKLYAAQTEIAAQAGINATPSFAINGAVLTGTHDWATLKPQLDARM